jgi:hypothetical protein
LLHAARQPLLEQPEDGSLLGPEVIDCFGEFLVGDLLAGFERRAVEIGVDDLRMDVALAEVPSRPGGPTVSVL